MQKKEKKGREIYSHGCGAAWFLRVRTIQRLTFADGSTEHQQCSSATRYFHHAAKKKREREKATKKNVIIIRNHWGEETKPKAVVFEGDDVLGVLIEDAALFRRGPGCRTNNGSGVCSV